MNHKHRDALLGLSVADALGVPYEFLEREDLRAAPAVDMVGYGTHKQPAGTWSDDSSLAFCCAESLVYGYKPEHMGRLMVRWYQAEVWTPHGKVFDIGIGTAKSLQRIQAGSPVSESGLRGEKDNGNGSLMRILPLLFFIHDKPIAERWQVVAEVSSITHAHIRSIIACFIYLEYARLILHGQEKIAAFRQMQDCVTPFLKSRPEVSLDELNTYHRLLQNPIGPFVIQAVHECPEDEIQSSGYVVHTLEAAFWCFLRHETYAAICLAAVNLGKDTDTTACVAGGLAGLYLGADAIPENWLGKLQKRDAIEALAAALALKYPLP